MWKVAPVLLLLLATPRLTAQSAVQPAEEQARILGLENAWDRAVKEKDVAALKMLLAPELVYVDYDGKLLDKVQYLASVQSPTVLPQRIVSESMNVHLYGAVAVVSGVYRETGEKNGKPYMLRERFTDTWVLRSESWMCVASHSTSISQ